MISTIGCSISLVGIALTILMQVCFWRQIKSPRAKVLLSLCVAIGFTNIFSILEGVARDNTVRAATKQDHVDKSRVSKRSSRRLEPLLLL